MRARINSDLVAKLDGKPGDIRDTKLAGFFIRCRRSGTASFVVTLGRGRNVTLGRVGTMTAEQARIAAETVLSTVSRTALQALADDPALGLRGARARARGTLAGPRANRRATWREFLNETYAPWVLEHQKTGASTLQRLRVKFADFNDQRLGDITAFAIERWRAGRLRGGAGPATVQRDLAALQGALSRAREWRLIRQHPMDDVKPLKFDRMGRVRFLSADEESRLLAALAARDERRRQARAHANAWRRERGYPEMAELGVYTDHLTPVVLLALHTGLRRGELLGLTWRDVNVAGATLAVRAEDAKSGRARVVPLNRTATDVLRAWRPADVPGSALVFPGPAGDRMTSLKTAFAVVLGRAAIVGCRFHDLRHSFASKLVQAGIDLNVVRELLGHANLTMTLRYAHLRADDRAAAVAKLVSA